MTTAVIPDLIRDPVEGMHWIAGRARNDKPEASNDKSGSARRYLAAQARRSEPRLGIADQRPRCTFAGAQDADALRHQLVGHRVEQRATVNKGHDGFGTGCHQHRQRLDDALGAVDVEARPCALLQ